MREFSRFYKIISITSLFGAILFSFLPGVAESPAGKSFNPGIMDELALFREQYNFKVLRDRKHQQIEEIIKASHETLYDSTEDVARLILEKSEEYGLEPALVLAIIKTESNFQRFVVSRKGAIGFMQLLPPTASGIARAAKVNYTHKSMLYQGEENIALGTYYVSDLIRQFGDVKLALEAYNRGPSALRKTMRKGKKVNYPYADRVMEHYQRYSETLTSM